jgi:hypothetical protein
MTTFFSADSFAHAERLGTRRVRILHRLADRAPIIASWGLDSEGRVMRRWRRCAWPMRSLTIAEG